MIPPAAHWISEQVSGNGWKKICRYVPIVWTLSSFPNYKTDQVGFCGLSLNHSISELECSNEMGQKSWYRGLNIVVKNIYCHEFNYGLVFLIFLICLVRFYWHTLYTINTNDSFLTWFVKIYSLQIMADNKYNSSSFEYDI